MNIEMLADYACTVGEGPLWHPGERRVYWTDIETGRMFWYDPATGRHQQCYQGPRVGGYTLQADGSLLLFRHHGNVATWRDGKELKTIIPDIPLEDHGRFNDVIADPEGRVFCGTLRDDGKPGRLYRLDPDRTLTLLLDGIGCANGMGFTADLKTLYFTDTGAGTIYAFDYDRQTGAISNQRPFIKARPGTGGPDGLTVDSQGDLYSAHWGGGGVFRYTPDGREKDKIALPAQKVSCPTFGGPDYADLYITTAGGNTRGPDEPHAGALFRVRPGVKGVPEFVSKIA